MKTKLFFISVAAFVFVTGLMPAVFVSTSYATTGINIISQTHHVWGFAGWQEVEEYNLTDTNPVSKTVHGWGLDGNYGTATSSAGDFQVSAYRMGDAASATARAESTYVFAPTTTALSLAVSGSIGEWTFENSAKFSLTDINTGQLLANYISERFPPRENLGGYAINWQQNYQVDPLHQYSIWMYVEAKRGEGGDGSAQLNAILTPEPATLLLLGLGAVIVRKRRR